MGGKNMAIGVGQTAPDFALQNQDKKEVKLSDFAGKKNVVLVWYPLDWSPTCTNEHACFVNDMRSFDQLDAEVLGVSVDSTWSHKAYADKMGIKYSLLADFHPKGAMSEKYGMYLADKGITGRAIAIVNKQGKIAWFKNYDIPVVPDLKEVASALSQVKAATAEAATYFPGAQHAAPSRSRNRRPQHGTDQPKRQNQQAASNQSKAQRVRPQR